MTVRGAGRRPGRRVLVALLATACTAPPAAEVPAPPAPTPVTGAPGPAVSGPTTLRVGLGPPPASIDPRLVVDDAGELVARALHEGLVDVAPGGGVAPAGAETWRTSADGTEIRFRLRRATFHDGRPVTARDHAEALLAALDPARPPYGREGALAGLRGAVVVADDGTRSAGGPADVLAAGGVEVRGTWDLVLRLTAPDPGFLHALTDVALAPLPPGRDDAGAAGPPVGNGPFRLLEPPGDDAFLRLVAVPDHHRAPRVAELLLQFHPDDPEGLQRWEALTAGRLQIAELPPARRADALTALGPARPVPPGPTTGHHVRTEAAVYVYAFDTTVAPYDDVRLRRALAAAVDRGAAAAAAGPAAVPAVRLLPPGLLADRDAAAPCPHCGRDPELAAELFAAWVADAAPELPLPVSLSVPRRADHAAVAEAVATTLEDVLDVRVTLRALDPEGLAGAVAAGEAPVFRPALRAAVGGTAAASTLLDPAFRATAPRPAAGTGWGDAESDALLDRLRGTPDPGAAAALDAALTGDAVVVPLVWLERDLAVAPGVRGFALDPTGRWWPERIGLG